MSEQSARPTIIPPGSTVLVTGANGFVAAHVCAELLIAGFRVRGAVRNASKNAWMTNLFTELHGSGKFELAEVPDIAAPRAWDQCIKGVSAVAHVASTMTSDVKDIDKLFKQEIPIHSALLEAASKEPSVKSVAMVSSAWAAYSPDPSKVRALTESSWNDEAVELARDSTVPADKKSFFTPLMAVKTLVEKEIWHVIKNNQFAFIFNTVLLDTVIGRSVDPKNQGLTSSAAMVCWPWDGIGIDILNSTPPQWHFDAEDAGRLFVAALTVPGVNRERLFGFGARFSWFRVAEILKELDPKNPIAEGIKDVGWDQTEVPNGRVKELLKVLGRDGITSLEDSVKAAAETWGQARGL